MTHSLKKFLIAAGIGGAIFTGLALHASPGVFAGGNENCEPSRWLGAFGTGASASGNNQGGGMMRRRGQGRGKGWGRGQGRGKGWGRGQGGGQGRGQGHGQGRGMGGQGQGGGNVVRHRLARTQGVPAPYADMKNPLPASADVLKAGKQLYEDNCVSCHGAKGLGDGEAGKELSPKPANLAGVMNRPVATDGLLMWAIAEGGEKLKTDMPAFKEVLSEKDRWRLISYLRNGLRS